MVRKEMVIAAVIGMLLLVVSFSLFVPLNRATGNLYNFFQNSCQEGNSRFQKVFVGITGDFNASAATAANEYKVSDEIFGGAGSRLIDSSGECATSGAIAIATVPEVSVGAQTAGDPYTQATLQLYNELGENIGTHVIGGTSASTVAVIPAVSSIAAAITLNTGDFNWYEPDDILGDFIGIIKTLISLSPVIVTAGFLALAGAGLIQYGMGVGSGGISGAIGGAVMALVINIVIMYLAPIGMSAVIEAGTYTQTGALAVNAEFSGVQRLLFAVIPLIMVAVIIGSNALAGGSQFGVMKGNKGGGGSMMSA